jgi:hypothetical protein
MNIRGTLHNIDHNIYKIEYNSFSRKVRNQNDPDSELPHTTTITTTVDQPNNTYTDM